jgi:hypothetical protein
VAWSVIAGLLVGIRKDRAVAITTLAERGELSRAARSFLRTEAGSAVLLLGAAVVAPAGGTALTDRVGGRGIAFNSARNQNYQSYGYPAAPPFDGERLWRCTSALQSSDTDANPPTLGIGCDMTGGSSGGGWIVGSNVVSVNSYGYDNQPDVMYGPYQGTVAQSLYNAAAAG